MEVEKEKEPEMKETTKEVSGANEAEVFVEDDDFEEFEIEDWDENDMDRGEEKLREWEDNWDDEDADDDFAKKLRDILAITETKPK